jgi:hypothetical protein
MRLISLFLLLCTPLLGFAQTAVVVELSVGETRDAKQLYEAKMAADKAWEIGYARLLKKHEFSNGDADFSKDFRFMVPKTGSAITWGSGTCGTWMKGCDGIYTTPTITMDSGYRNFILSPTPNSIEPTPYSAPNPDNNGFGRIIN